MPRAEQIIIAIYKYTNIVFSSPSLHVLLHQPLSLVFWGAWVLIYAKLIDISFIIDVL